MGLQGPEVCREISMPWFILLIILFIPLWQPGFLLWIKRAREPRLHKSRMNKWQTTPLNMCWGHENSLSRQKKRCSYMVEIIDEFSAKGCLPAPFLSSQTMLDSGVHCRQKEKALCFYSPVVLVIKSFGGGTATATFLLCSLGDSVFCKMPAVPSFSAHFHRNLAP